MATRSVASTLLALFAVYLQAQHGLAADLLSVPPCAPEFKQGVLNGATSDCVRALQRGLVLLTNPALQIDGDFGPITDAAVKAFQSSNNLQADGWVGARTRAAINARFVVAQAPPSDASSTPSTPTVTASIRLHVYIPTKLVDSLSLYGTRWLEGDDRSASVAAGSSRVTLRATIKMQGSKILAVSFDSFLRMTAATILTNLLSDSVQFGESRGYTHGQVNNLGQSLIGLSVNLPGPEYYRRCKKNLPVWACAEVKPGEQPTQVKRQVVTDDRAKVTANRESPTTGSVNFFVNAQEPLDIAGPDAAVPKISANINVKFTVAGSLSVNVAVTGKHDKFPNYEMYVANQFVYGYDVFTQGNGFGPLSLAGAEASISENWQVSLD